MGNFVEVQEFEDATHVQVIESRFPALKLVDGKVYDLKYGDMNDEWNFDEYHIVNEIGQNLHVFGHIKCKLLLEV